MTRTTSYIGWWVDDIRLFTCPNEVASVPLTTVAAGTTSAKVSWQPPTYVGPSSPVMAYRVTRSTGQVATFPKTTRSTTLTGLNPARALTVSVVAVNEAAQAGAPATVRIDPTTTAISSATRVARNAVFPITTKVTLRGARTTVAGMPVTLQRRSAGSTVWSSVSSRTTTLGGHRDVDGEAEQHHRLPGAVPGCDDAVRVDLDHPRRRPFAEGPGGLVRGVVV